MSANPPIAGRARTCRVGALLAKGQTGRDVMAPYRKIEYARLLTEFCETLPEPGLAAHILTVNPRRLYGFLSES